MKYLPNKGNNYISKDLIGKYIYSKTSNKDMDIHRIFKIKEIKSEHPITYDTEKYYYFTIPYNQQCKCFCYGDESIIQLTQKDELYIMQLNEYINTFHEFIENESKYPYEIPSKIIQDII